MELMRLNMNTDIEFKLIVVSYKMPFAETNSYYENNWLEGYIEINKQEVIKLELLQVEELLELNKWIEDLISAEDLQPDFVFIDSFARLKHLIRSNNYKYVKFIFDENEKEPIVFEFSLNEIKVFGNEVLKYLTEFPIR